MKITRLFIAIGMVALASWVSPRVGGQEKQDPSEGFEVLARGPVHEAFAQPSAETQPEAGPMIEKQPPDPIEELPPEQRPEGDNISWIPGYWQWDQDRGDFIWISGLWRATPPDRIWVPGAWHKVDGGYRWTSGYWAPASSEGVTYLPPPPDPLENGPATEAPGDDYVYVPGCWYYRDTRYAWRAGYWLHCNPGWVWRPSYYVWSPAGCVFVSGFWDYPLDRCGLLFAPVWFQHDYYSRRGFAWTPNFVVRTDFLTLALFANSRHRHYYFGDYYDARYRNRGFTPWVDVRIGRTGYDPLFGYYRATADRRDWETRVRGVYADRSEHRDHRPPQTLAQQNVFVRNRTNADVQNAVALAPLAQAARQQERQLRAVSSDERSRLRETTREMHSLANERARTERKLIQDKAAPIKSGAAPRAVQLPPRHVDPRPRDTGVPPVVRPPRGNQPKADPPKSDPPRPRVDPPKPPPKADPPKPPPRSDPPRQRVDPPKPPPKADPPKPPPRSDPPRQRVDPPKPPPKADPPKPRPRSDPPKPPPKADPPKPPSKPDRPRPPERATQPKPGRQAEQPRSQPRQPQVREQPRSAPRAQPRSNPPPRQQASPPSRPSQPNKPRR